MKPRYNLRFQPTKPLISITKKKPPSISSSSRVFVIDHFSFLYQNGIFYSRVKKAKPRRSNPVITEQTRRHSLRLTPTVKKGKSRGSIDTPRWRKVENENYDDDSLTNNTNDDDLDELLTRHRRLTLEERKDRK
jgi:hypothetical protein